MEEYTAQDAQAPALGAGALDTQIKKAKKYFLGVWTCAGAILLTVVVVYLASVLSVAVSILLWSVVIVFCLRGTVSRLEGFGMPRVWGVALAYILMFVVLALVALLMSSPAFGVGDQFSSLVENVPFYLKRIIAWASGIYTQYADLLANDTVQKYLNDALESVGLWASELAKSSASGVVAVGTGIANSFVAIGFAFVVAFWILIELPAIGRESMRLAGPRHAETFTMLHITFTRVMGGYIKGTILQCAIIGILCGVVFAVLGIPYYAALGAITGLLNIIPIIGPWLGGALAALVGVFVSPWVALVAVVATVVIQQVVYTFVSPRIMANSVDVHPVLTLLALMGGSAIGAAMSGFIGSLVGMLASIPAVAVMKSIFVYYFEKRTGRQLVSEDGVFFRGVPAQPGGVDPIADAISPHPDVSIALERIEQRKAEFKRRTHHHSIRHRNEP